MAKFNVAARHEDNTSLIDVYQGNTFGPYGIMADSLYVGRIVVNTQTGKVEELGTASWQVNSWAPWLVARAAPNCSGPLTR